jgi:hypothetical protein
MSCEDFPKAEPVKMYYGSGRRKAYVVAIGCISVVTAGLLVQNFDEYEGWTSKYTNRGLMRFQEAMINSEKVKSWRRKTMSMCEGVEKEKDMLAVRKSASGGFQARHEHESTYNEDLSPENLIQRCPFIFLDLGSGVGDSIGKFIEAGFVGCKNDNFESLNFDPMHFDTKTGVVGEEIGKRDGEIDEELTEWIKNRMLNYHEDNGPEDYCVYGVEGNPLLKPDLTKLERHINRMDPRPLRHLHFFTDTVVFDQDNTKKQFFVDTVHHSELFPGSSLFFNHKHVRESRLRHKDSIEHTVDTMTLSSLMKQTLSYYDEDTFSESNITNPYLNFEGFEKKTPQHLLLHVDIEGAEFQVLNEIKDSGLLCDFARDGNFVDIFVSYHDPEMIGFETPNAKRYTEEVRPFFRRECGDNLSLYERGRYFMPESKPEILSNAIV